MISNDLRASLRRALWIGAAALAGIVGTFALAVLAEERTDRWVRHSQEVLGVARAANALVVARQAGARGFMLQPDSAWIARDAIVAAQLAPRLDSLRALTEDNPAQQTLAVAIAEAIGHWQTEWLAEVYAGTSAERAALLRDRQLMMDVRDRFADFVAAEDSLHDARLARDRLVRRSGLIVLLAEVLVIALVLSRLGQRLRRKAAVLAEQQAQLQDQAVELEQQTEEAQELTQELEMSNEELRDALEETRAAREAERSALAQLDAALSSSPVAFASYDRELRYVRVNPAYSAISGHPAEAHVGRRISDMLPALAPTVLPVLERVLATGEPALDVEVKGLTASGGQTRHFRASYYPIREQDGKVVGAGVVVLETTAQRELEAQLRQAQKMEAVGQLAGGIAHDFNNVLTAIRSFSELLLEEMPQKSRHRGDVIEIRSAADRAAALTRQLLAFSRRQLLQPVPLDLNEVVRGLEDMLGRLLGEDVECVWRLDQALDTAIADPGQIEQIVMNLAVNARDAMPRGGRLTIETANVVVDDAYAERVGDLAPGGYVVLAVSDTGAGMDAVTQGRIFEPFFTTKDPGKGTGLGLSTVYGIVKQSGGHITVYSESGNGTTFRVYLPRSETVARTSAPARPAALPMPTGTETVLLVEDDPAVRLVACRILTRQGYRVLEAPSPAEAQVIAARQSGAVDLLMTDLVLPGMSGRELAERLCAAEPAMRVLFMSGYTDDAVIRRGLLEPTMAFLGKPFTVDELARVVRRTLDAETVAPGSTTAIEPPESVPGSSSLPARRDPRSTKK